MADTIESFVEKLKSEGVEQGKREAEKLESEARTQADRILADARQQADKIVADARAEANNILHRGQTELELAARDAILKLHQTLERVLRAVLEAPVEGQLEDEEFLKDLIRSITVRYVEADLEGAGPVKLNVGQKMREELARWAQSELARSLKNEARDVRVTGELRQSGFELGIHGATIEVTRESVLETLMELVGPSLRETLGKAARSEEGK